MAIDNEEEFKRWFRQAEADLRTAEYNIKGQEVEAGVFFLQQSVEKALKAVYIKRTNTLLRTHDLVLLARKVNVPKEILNSCKELSPAYLYTRYPDVPPENDLNVKANEFVSYTKEILKWVEKNI